MHQYPSDISREEYDLIREDLEGARKRTRPRQYDLYDVFCAVLYVVQGGILPSRKILVVYPVSNKTLRRWGNKVYFSKTDWRMEKCHAIL